MRWRASWSIALVVSTIALHASAQDPVWPPPDAAASTAPVAPTPVAPAPIAPAAHASPPPLAPLAPAAPVAPTAAAAPSVGRTTARPTSVAAYAQLRRRLREELKTAERHDRDADAERLRNELETVDDWYREDVERRSTGAFVSGIIATSLGGLSLLTGLGLQIATAATDAGNADRDVTEALQVSADITLLSGVALLGAGIPLMVWGGGRVMADEYEAARTAAPRVTVSALLNGARLDARF